MPKNGGGFTVIEGFRQDGPRTSSHRFPTHWKTGQVPRGYSRNKTFRNVRGDLAIALAVAEERVCALLRDRIVVGRELHNTVLQSLNTLRLAFRPKRPCRSSTIPSTARRCRQALEQAAQKLRRLILELESGAVKNFNLDSELRRLVSTYRTISPLPISLDVRARALEFLTQEEELGLLTVAREALSNCVRHADASQAAVSLRTHRTRVALTIRDNGKGFSRSGPRSSGYGLANIAACVEKLGWTLDIKSRTGRGTIIKVEYVPGPILSAV